MEQRLFFADYRDVDGLKLPFRIRRYSGADPAISRNLRLLQSAMSDAGFLAMRDEWWHFVARDYREFGPIDNAALTP